MLGRAAERFIRTVWRTPQELAEELYATFSPLQPIEASKIIINQSPEDASPPFVINRPGDASGPTIQINRGGGGATTFGDITIHGNNYGDTNFDFNSAYGLPDRGSTLTIGGFGSGGGIGGFGDGTEEDGGGDIIAGGGGGVDLAGIYFPDQELGSVPLPQDNPIMLYGETVSKESGQTYEVNVWAKTPTGPRIGRIRVRFTMIDPGEEIPVGVPCVVLAFPGTSGGNRIIVDAVGFVPAFMQETF